MENALPLMEIREKYTSMALIYAMLGNRTVLAANRSVPVSQLVIDGRCSFGRMPEKTRKTVYQNKFAPNQTKPKMKATKPLNPSEIVVAYFHALYESRPG